MNPRVVYVLLVTDGTIIEYPPEIYRESDRAAEEAERWAWILGGGGWAEIRRPFEGRWVVGDREVRLISAEWTPEPDSRPWIGTYWTEDGLPDPEGLVLWGRDSAHAWVMEPPLGSTVPRELTELPWMLAATYERGGDEAYAVAHLAKVIAE